MLISLYPQGAELNLMKGGSVEPVRVRRALTCTPRPSKWPSPFAAMARATLAKHRHDPRHPVYTCEQFESAATCDDLWNATRKE